MTGAGLPHEGSIAPVARPRRWRWVRAGAVVCALSWLALGAGIVLGMGRPSLLALTTLAALTTEGLIWLTALVLGTSAYSARRQLWQSLRQWFRRSSMR